MNEADTSIRTTLRIPGNWPHPGELIERMPSGFRLTSNALILPDDTQIECTPIRRDGQFAQIFKSSCRQPATNEEMAVVNDYSVNIALTGPGGSLEAALTMMHAGASIVRAGGAGVFIDNSALAHGGENWIAMAEDGGPDALSFAFVSIVRGQRDVWTMGMHVLGFPDVVMGRSDLDTDGDIIIEVIRYVCMSSKPIRDGHWVADLDGLRFKAVATGSDEFDAGSPMHNPFGRLKLLSIKDIAEGN